MQIFIILATMKTIYNNKNEPRTAKTPIDLPFNQTKQKTKAPTSFIVHFWLWILTFPFLLNGYNI